jgi:nucleoside-diphosphate-sugar epimerase
MGSAVNIASGARISLQELAQRIGAASGRPEVAPRHDPSRPGDVRHSLADISRAGDLLGFQAEIDIDEGLRRTVQWYRDA